MKQRGFTLVEMIVALAVTGLVAATTTGVIYQVWSGQVENSGTAIALADIDQAAHWLTQDLGQAQTIEKANGEPLLDDEPPVSHVTLRWQDQTSWAETEGSVSHYVTYCFNQVCTDPPCDAQSTSELRRDYDGQVTTVGKHLTKVEFSINDQIVTVTLTSSHDSYPNVSETRTYQIYLRPEPRI